MKTQKERMTIMVCAIATGEHKLPLMCIGKAANPRCFKNLNKAALPVTYYAQKNAWVSTEIFSNKTFVPEVTAYLKNERVTSEGSCLTMFLHVLMQLPLLVTMELSEPWFCHPNTTALFQPLDQGVLESFKRRYRKSLLQNLLLEGGQSLTSSRMSTLKM